MISPDVCDIVIDENSFDKMLPDVDRTPALTPFAVIPLAC